MTHLGRSTIPLGLILLFVAANMQATPPPFSGGSLPEAYHQRAEREPRAFTISEALDRIKTIQANRASAARGVEAMDEAEELEEAGGIAVVGDRFLPVIPVKFKDAEDPFPANDLQGVLFDNRAGTLTEYYREVSYGRLNVTGRVLPWQSLSREDTFYEGGDFRRRGQTSTCNGLCSGARIKELIKEALQAADPLINFSEADLTGPDGAPDGFVDAIAFVHSEPGGECRQNETTDPNRGNIWSHQWTYMDLTPRDGPYITQDKTRSGDPIKVNAFLITSALDCEQPQDPAEAARVARIGVITHEFGHTLGLPDLYDTDSDNGISDRVGNWDLMAGGAWGGDGTSPERPVHLSAWSKAYLGWITPDKVKNRPQYQPATIPAIETTFLAYMLALPENQYYLIENRQQQGYDEGLPGSGLLIWHIDNEIVEPGVQTNRVNAGLRKGVSLVQADNRGNLDHVDGLQRNRGDDGDPFPGLILNRSFHNGSRPASLSSRSICSISDSGPAMSATLLVTSGACPDQPQAALAAPQVSLEAVEPEAPSRPAGTLSLKELTAAPERYINRRVRLVGKLVNLGANYFTDRRIALQDAEGNTIAVLPWLALEAAPGSKDQPRLPTLSNYLNKTVEIVGEVERKTDERGGESLVLDVTSAEVIPPP